MSSDNVKDHDKKELEITEERKGSAFVGYKAKEEKTNKKGIIVGQFGKQNSYIRKLQEDKDYNAQFNKLNTSDLTKRRNIIGSGTPDHNKFLPTKIEEKSLEGGKKQITYTYAEGEQEFTIILNANGYPISAKGDKLTLHDLGRGVTQNSEGKIINAGMDSAHLIANMFGGSGYKVAENIVATSAEYNQKAMREREGGENLSHFTLQVDLEFGEENDSFEIEEIRKVLEKYTKEDDERRLLSDSELIQEIESRLSQTDQPRVKEVYYDVILTLNDGVEINQDFELIEADLLFGTK